MAMRSKVGAKTFAGVAVVAGMTTVAEAQQPVATGWVDTPQSRLRLVGGADPGSPGARVLLLEMTLQPNWKTYWRMPGDAGIPPTFDWTGSKNVGDIEVRYPAPAMYVDKAGRTIGYKTAVTFPIVVRPADANSSSEVRVEVAFGICREICIPVETKLSLDVPPAATLSSTDVASAMSRVPARKDAKDAARGPVAVSSVALQGGATAPKLLLKTAGVETLLIEAPEGLFVPIPERVSGDATAATFEVDLSKSQDLPDLKGKPLTITAIGPNGAIETSWSMPSSL